MTGQNLTVTEIDVETLSMDITVYGDNIDVPGLYRAIEQCGAVVHSLDEIVTGDVVVERVARGR